jgi:hypothetical protein
LVLGSKRFREGEAGTRALDRAGEPALPALRRAEEHGADPEVRRRAGALVERLAPVWAKHILDSDLRHAEQERGAAAS